MWRNCVCCFCRTQILITKKAMITFSFQVVFARNGMRNVALIKSLSKLSLLLLINAIDSARNLQPYHFNFSAQDGTRCEWFKDPHRNLSNQNWSRFQNGEKKIGWTAKTQWMKLEIFQNNILASSFELQMSESFGSLWWHFYHRYLSMSVYE